MRKLSIIITIFTICFLSGLSEKAYSKIVYSSNQNGISHDIWVMDDNGDIQIQLTNSPSNEYSPRWSPDSSKIVYHSDQSGNFDIWVMDSDGSNQTQLTFASAIDTRPTWTPDGTKILFYSRRSSNGDVWIMNSDGSGQTRLTYMNGKTGRDGIDVSPDGSKIVYTSQPSGGNWGYNAQMYMDDFICTDGAETCYLANKFQLSFDNEHECYPRFTPDGASIIWSTGRRNPYGHCASNCYFTTYEIYSIDTDGSNEYRITDNTVTRDIMGSLSSDGSTIFFASDRDSGSAHVSNTLDIWAVGIDGQNLVRLTSYPGTEQHPDHFTPIDYDGADAGGPYTANEGEFVTFDASASSGVSEVDILKFRWDFESDGVWDTYWSNDPTADFKWGDDYSGTVTVEVSVGALSDTANAAVTILNVAPTANIDSVATPDPLMPGDTVEFEGSATDPGGDLLTYVWDFGESAKANGLIVEHAYENPGTYTVTLTVSDDDGGSDSVTHILTVKAPNEVTSDLIIIVENLGLHSGTEKSLISKLNSAIQSLGSGNTKAAKNKLNAFIKEVKAQRGKNMPEGQADYLIQYAQAIINHL